MTRIKVPGRHRLAERLRARRAEIEEAILARIKGIDDSVPAGNVEYSYGLQIAVAASIEYCLEFLELGGKRPPPPRALLEQARQAVRMRVGLDTVLRRYFAGYALLSSFVDEELRDPNFSFGFGEEHTHLTGAAVLDDLLAAVSAEYVRARAERQASALDRKAEKVRRLLSGEALSTTGLAYDFNAIHIGLVAASTDAEDSLCELAAALERRFLVVHDDMTIWMWIESQTKLDLRDCSQQLFKRWPAEIPLAAGEPGKGLSGWRLTHRQAQAALAIARYRPGECVHYADTALLASALGDELLATSLSRLYLDPLTADKAEAGRARLDALRAYFASGHNVSAAAASLGVHRRTLGNRLREIEDEVGSLSVRAAEIGVALRLHDHNVRSTTQFAAQSGVVMRGSHGRP